jgi:hypothetical protein
MSTFTSNKFLNYYLPLLIAVVLVVAALAFYLAGNSKTPVAEAGWYNTGGTWQYRKALTINHTKVNTATGTTTPLSNFPVLYSVASNTIADLKFTGFSGGKVASSTGADILFTDSNGTSLLNYEIDNYASSTGELEAWIKIPSLPSTADYTIYMYYGNASAPANTTSNRQNTWSNGYAGVWHLGNVPTTANDSTANANNGTNHGATATTTIIDGGAAFSGSPNYIGVATSTSLAVTTGTISAWINLAVSPTSTAVWNGVVASAPWNVTGWNGYWLGIRGSSGGAKIFTVLGASSSYIDDTQGSVSMATGTWYSLVFTWDGSYMRQYVNGAAAGTPVSQTIVPVTNVNQTNFGKDGGGDNSFYLVGSIDEPRISSIARSADWIATEYNNQSSPSTFFSSGLTQTQAPSVQVNVRGGNSPTTPSVRFRGGASTTAPSVRFR